MLETAHHNKLVEPPKAISSAKIDVRLRILILFMMLIGSRNCRMVGHAKDFLVFFGAISIFLSYCCCWL